MISKINKIKNFNLAEWLALLRLLSIPFLIVLTLMDLRYLAALFFLLSFCTDALDGFLGRLFHRDNRKLSKLDSAADMCLLATGLFTLVYFETSFFINHLFWLLLVLVFYFGQLFYAFHRYGKPSSFHTLLARFAAVVQTIFISYSLFYTIHTEFFFFTISVSLLETTAEILLIIKYPNYPGQINGIRKIL